MINSVLKEIDDRPALFRPVNLDSAESEQKNAASSRTFLPMLAVFLAVLLIFLLAYYLFGELEREKAVSSISGSEAVTERVPVSDINMPAQYGVVGTNQPLINDASTVFVDMPVDQQAVVNNSETYLTGLQITESPRSLELWFHFDSDFRHFLKRRSGNRYQFQISDAVSQIESPSFDGQWLNTFDIRVDQEHLLLDLVTADKVLLSTSDAEQGNDHYWIVRLERLKEERSVKTDAPPIPVSSKAVTTREESAEVLVQQAPPQSEVKLAIKPISQPESNQQRLEDAMAGLQAGRWRQAVTRFRNLLGSDVDRQARLNLLALYQSRQMYAEFDNHLQLSLVQYSEDGEFQVIDANRLFQKERYQELINRYSAVVDQMPITSLIAAAYQRLGNHALAASAYQQALQVDAGQGKNWISLAISLEKLDQNNKALQAYQAALKSNGLNTRLRQFVSGRIQALTAGN